MVDTFGVAAYVQERVIIRISRIGKMRSDSESIECRSFEHLCCFLSRSDKDTAIVFDGKVVWVDQGRIGRVCILEPHKSAAQRPDLGGENGIPVIAWKGR